MTIDASIPLQAGKGVAPIDPMQNAVKAYSLAGTMVDTQEKIRERDDGLHDRDALQNYLISGGDITTPEGSKKAVQELQGKISPQFTEKLMAHSDQVTNNFLKQKEMMAKLPEMYLEQMKAQEEQVAPMLEQLDKQYKNTLSTQGQAAADAEFEKNRQGVMGWMSQQQLGGQPRFSPDVAKSMSQLTPDSLPYFLAHTKYHTTLIDDRLKEAKINATEGGKRTFYSDGKDEYMQNDRGITMKNVNGTWENVDILPANARKIGTQKASEDTSSAVQLEPGAKTTLAMNYILHGTQALARFNPSDRKDTMNEADRVRKALGLSSGELATLEFSAKAKGKALGNLENLGGQVEAFEKSLNNYTNRALENLNAIKTSDIPWLNKIVQNLEGHVEGLPPDLAKLQVNLRAVASEYNKLSSGAMGNTQPGEKSLLEIQEMFKKSDNPDTLRATLSEVLKDGQFRAKGIRETKDAMQESITGLLENKNTRNTPSASGDAKVSLADQSSRDSDRNSILRDEKAKSVAQLNALDPKAPDYAEKKARIQGDIRALNKEMGAKDDTPTDKPADKPTGKTRELTINGKKITVQVE